MTPTPPVPETVTATAKNPDDLVSLWYTNQMTGVDHLIEKGPRSEIEAELTRRLNRGSDVWIYEDRAPQPPATPTDAAGVTTIGEDAILNFLDGNLVPRDQKLRLLRAHVAASIAKERADSKRDIIEVFYQHGDPPFVSKLFGRTNGNMIEQVESDLTENLESILNKGAGIYRFDVYFIDAQTNEVGRVELPGYWELDLLEFTPLGGTA